MDNFDKKITVIQEAAKTWCDNPTRKDSVEFLQVLHNEGFDLVEAFIEERKLKCDHCGKYHKSCVLGVTLDSKICNEIFELFKERK